MKTFLKDFSSILNNQRGSMDLGSEGSTESVEADSGSEDLSTEGLLASLDSESGSDSESESTGNESPEGEEPGPDSENVGDDLEAQLKAYEAGDKSEGEEGVNPLLEELNKLGIFNKGMPVEFDDIEKVKEHLSKGFDYTQKTQELAEMRKEAEASITQERESFEQERVQFQEEIAQHEQSLTNYGIFQRMVSDIKKSDPELFEELDRYYQSHESQVRQLSDNPEVNALKKQIAELQEQVQGSSESKEAEELGQIKKSWETGVSEVQASFGPKLRSLGVKPDWAKVQEVWKADSSNTMSVKDALFAKYGEQISKAMANKNKLAETRAKVARTGTKPQDDGNEKIFGMTSGNSYENEAFEILKTL